MKKARINQRHSSDRKVRNIATSPAASGPAGPRFEAQVAAYYLLSMLAATEPRGLPGTAFDRVELQRAAEGHPLDDIIVHAHDLHGTPAVLAIQVKRSMSFAPSDDVFRAVVYQIAESAGKPEFWTSRYELAIAIARTSQKIDGAYQDVLTWARQIGDAATFTARIARPGSANDDMRTFLSTFRSHLHDAGAADDDETIWRLLRRLQILVFDFTVQGSASEELAKERAAQALHSDAAIQAPQLWATLIDLALEVAASGGDRTRQRLLDDLASHSFLLAGSRHYSSTRTFLAEASRHALADIVDKVGNVMLTRHERVGAVHAALDGGRYVEIRGDAGVGKSGILKHLAGQMGTEAQIIVLSPGRTTPGGLTAMRAVLSFDGAFRELLGDVAANGGGALFIDNLDFFSPEEQRTVVDLVREAANVPGLAVIATARRSFGKDDPNWLPRDALLKLGIAEPVIVGELSECEIDELRHVAPHLASLLAESHPARAVTRNLFRLARLANLRSEEPIPRTEVDMAEQWWQTADGAPADDRRQCSRILSALAEHSLASDAPLDVRDHPPKAIEWLIRRGTLREVSPDRVLFRHDVLREWAIAHILHTDPSIIERLPLDRPARANFARVTEIAARMFLETAADATSWEGFLESVSHKGVHGSWRRAVLLAVVHSEIGPELLVRTSPVLLADGGMVLRELIRIVMAVDVQPASTAFAAAGVPTDTIPEYLNVPSAPSWYRLIIWLLALGDNIPPPAIPDIVDFFRTWSTGTLGYDRLTPLLQQRLYTWLAEIETPNQTDNLRDLHAPFGGEIDHDRLRALEEDVRTGFLLFCNTTPDLAVDYLRSFQTRKYADNTLRSILQFRGQLAQAAPEELAEITIDTLIPKHRPKDRHYQPRRQEPFDFADYIFVPPSPAQGPFYELLTHSPQHGLDLIHRIVGHAISFYSNGGDYESDAITIFFPSTQRVCPWIRSYNWSRGESAAPACVTSALMALESWAHGRLDAGENFDEVLADVLGPAGTPAAYVLIAIDILLSHWPQSAEAAVPFVACPDLLCIDRERYVNDNMEVPDFFGLNALDKETPGAIALEKLKNRPSRRVMLDQLLVNYAFGPAGPRQTLEALLHSAAERLGPPENESTMRDPRLMVLHALNLLNHENWREVLVTLENGDQGTRYEYVSPEAEALQLSRIQEASNTQVTDTNMQLILGKALENPSCSSSELASAAVEWARNQAVVLEDDTEESMRREAVVSAAMIAVRDGTDVLRDTHEAWARTVFAAALNQKKDPVRQSRHGLRYNPVAIAFVGIIHLLRCRRNDDDVRTLLKAATDDPAAAHGFGVAATILASVDERLPRSVLRCAFAGCIQPSRKWDLAEREVVARASRQAKRLKAAVDAEVRWLADKAPEPDWPSFPEEIPVCRPRIVIGRPAQHDKARRRSEREEYVKDQAAALWLSKCAGLFNVSDRPWLRDIALKYNQWTAVANGAETDVNEDVTHLLSQWNEAYFTLLAYCLPGLDSAGISKLALTPVTSLPDAAFFDVMTDFLRGVDEVYFNQLGLLESEAVLVRSTLAQRMSVSRGWKRLVGNRTGSIEMRIAPAVATLFFNVHGILTPTRCYLLEKGIDRVAPFFPVLKQLMESAPCLSIAVVTLNVLEVSPRATHLSFLIDATNLWLQTFQNDSDFWVDHGIGRRVCLWIDAVRPQRPDQLGPQEATRADVDRLLAALVKVGVPEATRLEETLNHE